MQYPVFTYISNIWLVRTFCRYTQLKDQTVLFLTIQFSISKKLNGLKYCYVSKTIELKISHLFTHSKMIKYFYFKQFNLA